MKNLETEIEIQRTYYTKTAKSYDSMHLDEQGEHFFALSFMLSTIDYYQIKSILDIGSGTGRVISYIKKNRPDIHVVGIEPVNALREIGYSKGLSKEDLMVGDGTQLKYKSAEFDLVCEFGVLHHVKYPAAVIDEMLRVSGKAIFISDSNNFGQGSFLSRYFKQLIYFLGLWRLANFIKTKGKGYRFSKGDGLSYSYSVFTNYKQIQIQCEKIHLLNTKDGQINFFKTASHIALLGIKKFS